MSQKRVAVVLASLVGTLTVSAGLLLLMENAPLGATPFAAFTVSRADLSAMITPQAPLQSAAWDYIIVYESGDLEACAASLAERPSKGDGLNAGLATRLPANFHFVVDAVSSRRGALDGELEVGTSWTKQELGTPHAGWPDTRYHTYPNYKNAIGICLVGDLKSRPYSDAQSRSLLQLVRELQSQLRASTNPARKEAVKIVFQWELLPNALQASPAQKAFAEEFRRSLD